MRGAGTLGKALRRSARLVRGGAGLVRGGPGSAGGGAGLADLRGVLKRPRGLRRLTSGVSASLHTRGFVLWAAALATGILCVSQSVYSTKLAEQIEDLRSQRRDLEAEIGFLQMECARLSSRERIEAYASERLEMRYPEAHEVVRLGEGTEPSWDLWDEELVEGSTLAVSDG